MKQQDYIDSLAIGDIVTYWKKYKTCRSRHIFLKGNYSGVLVKKNQETLTLANNGKNFKIEKYRVVCKNETA